MLAFGGAGPMHAPFLAECLGINSILIPPSPGVFSALGLILADFRHDLVRGVMRQAAEVVTESLTEIFEDMESEASGILRKEGFGSKRMVLERKLDLRYLGQSYEITVPVMKGLRSTLDSFRRRHQEIYGYASESEPVEIVAARLVASGLTAKPEFKKAAAAAAAPSSAPLTDKRRVFFDAAGWIETPVYHRQALLPGARIEAPAIIEQYDATIIVPPGWKACVDELSNLCLKKGGGLNETRPDNH